MNPELITLIIALAVLGLLIQAGVVTHLIAEGRIIRDERKQLILINAMLMDQINRLTQERHGMSAKEYLNGESDFWDHSY